MAESARIHAVQMWQKPEFDPSSDFKAQVLQPQAQLLDSVCLSVYPVKRWSALAQPAKGWLGVVCDH